MECLTASPIQSFGLNRALGCVYLGQQSVLISRKVQLSYSKPLVNSGREVKSILQMSVFLDIKVLSFEEWPGVMVTESPIIKGLAVGIYGMCQDICIISLNPHHRFISWIFSLFSFTEEEREAQRCSHAHGLTAGTELERATTPAWHCPPT